MGRTKTGLSERVPRRLLKQGRAPEQVEVGHGCPFSMVDEEVEDVKCQPFMRALYLVAVA